MTSPALLAVVRRVKESHGEADIAVMDAIGAKNLADRIRTGVSVGMRIELTGEIGDESGLVPGDRGVVNGIDDDGNVVVHWDRGFTSGIDPDSTSFHRLAA